MKEWICREMSTSTGNSENGVLMREKELIRCKDCKKFVVEEDQAYCLDMFGQCDENGFCSWAERKEE